jgi:hypothetical protein
MRKRRMTMVLLLSLVVLLGFYSLLVGAQGAPHKQGKYLADKTPFQSASYKGMDKSLAEKDIPWQRTALGASQTLFGLWRRVDNGGRHRGSVRR